MAGRTDVQLGCPPTSTLRFHRSRIPSRWGSHHPPRSSIGCRNQCSADGHHPVLLAGWVLFKPSQGHPRIVFLEQGSAITQVAAVFEAASDRLPGLLIATAAGLECRQLQSPAHAEMPPVSATFTAPVKALVQPCHGWRKAVRRGRALWSEQLSQSLIGEAVTTKSSIALRQRPDPAVDLCGIGGFLGESPKASAGVPLSTDVLHHHQISLGCPPAGMRQGDR